MKTVAILMGDSALSSLVSGVIGAVEDVQVSELESFDTLTTFMRITPVDLVILNFEGRFESPVQMAKALHADRRLAFRGFGIIGLTRTITEEVRHAAEGAGIDELIAKPMSPRHLRERVLLRLGMSGVESISLNYQGPERRRPRPAPDAKAASRHATNVIELFGGGDTPRSP